MRRDSYDRRVVNDPGLFALKNAVRTALVMPASFAFCLFVLDLPQAALFAAFGSIGVLIFVEFGGPPRARLHAYALLAAGGLPLIALGTLCSRDTVAAVVGMAVVGFAILFLGVLNGYLAAAQTAAILLFVLPVMVPGDAAEIPDRLLGWALASALSIAVALLLWPRQPRDAIRTETAAAARSLAALLVATAGEGPVPPERVEASRRAIRKARLRLVALRHRPSGVGGRTAAQARLIEELGWLHATVERVTRPPAAAGELVPARVEVERLVPATLDHTAAALDGASTGVVSDDLAALGKAHRETGDVLLAALSRARPGGDEEEAGEVVEEGYRLRALAFGTTQVAAEALRALGEKAPEPVAVFKDGSAPTARLARVHASMRSVWLRNSLRGAAGLAAAVLVGHVTDVQNSFWVVLGTLSVLRSDAMATSSTIAEALAGTLVGIVAGGALIIAVDGSEAVLWATLPLATMLAAYAPRAISFLAGQAAFSLLVLILFNLLDTGGWQVGLVRIEDVAMGAAISLLVGLLLWPRGAVAVLRRDLGHAYGAGAAFLRATAEGMLGDRRADSEAAGREAFASFQLLDATVRDYLAGRGSARRPLADLAVLSGGAARLRYVASLMRDARVLIKLEPVEGDAAALREAREGFSTTLAGRCDWYAGLGGAITAASVPPPPEESAGRDRAPVSVALERPAGGDGVPPAVGMAWATLHLESLLAFEPALAEAAGRLSPGASRK